METGQAHGLRRQDRLHAEDYNSLHELLRRLLEVLCCSGALLDQGSILPGGPAQLIRLLGLAILFRTVTLICAIVATVCCNVVLIKCSTTACRWLRISAAIAGSDGSFL